MPNPEVVLTGFADEGSESKRAEEQLTMCRALGLSYYSLRFVDLGDGVKNLMALTKPEIKKLQTLHEAFEMSVSSIGSPLGKIKLVDKDDGTHNVYADFGKYLKNDVPKAVELAQTFGCKLIRGFSFYPPKEDDPWAYVDQAADYLSAIVDVCSTAGVFFGLEVEANLVGRNGELLAALHKRVASDQMYLIFDGANITCQGATSDQVFAEYRHMKRGTGWMHVKDYKTPPNAQWLGYVDEAMLRNFVPVGLGDSGYERILRDFKDRLPALTRQLRRQGVPGVFLDLEPHLKGGGQFGGFSGPDGFGVALRALTQTLDYVGIDYRLTEYGALGKSGLSG